MTWFSFHRTDGFPTQYEEIKSAVTADVLESGFILAFCILVISFYLVVPGYKGKEGLWICLRITLSLFVGATLMLGNFGQEWEVGDVHTKTPYKAGLADNIEAHIGVKLGLRSLNVTLKHEGEIVPHRLKDEVINYNERFEWVWDQGRFGFGPRAGLLQREFRHAQLTGLPIPILWVVEYFVIDGEGIRFGRFYRTAGWSAFPCWLLANLFFMHVVRYGGYFTMLTGGLQLLACILWTSIRNYQEIAMPLGHAILVTHFGIHFWLVFGVGVLCIILGLIITFLDLHCPDELSVFFGIDPLSDYEEYHLTPDELGNVCHQIPSQSGSDDIEMQSVSEPREVKTEIVFKRKGTITRAQKSLLRIPHDQFILQGVDSTMRHSSWRRCSSSHEGQLLSENN